jgi:hypothetical protein
MRMIARRRPDDGRRQRGGRAGRLSVCLAALGTSAALLLLAAGSAGSAGSTDRAGSVLAAGRGLAIEQLAPAAATAPSAAGDLAVTAAHCVSGQTGAMVFVPGYSDGRTPYGVWPVAKVYTDSAWDASQDPDHDVAFLRLSDAPDGAPIEDVTGAETLGADAPAGRAVQVIGYPDGAALPVRCSGLVKGFSATQFEFDCGGYTTGTSGGPFLTGVDAATGQGTVIGVIGGYQQGGDTPQVSYAAVFGTAVSQLYATAEAGG